MASFTGTSSETFRKVPDRVQIDTTLVRQNRVQNHALIRRRRLLNRTAVINGMVHSSGFEEKIARSIDDCLVGQHISHLAGCHLPDPGSKMIVLADMAAGLQGPDRLFAAYIFHSDR